MMLNNINKNYGYFLQYTIIDQVIYLSQNLFFHAKRKVTL